MYTAARRLRPAIILCFAVVAVAAIGVNDTRGG